MSQGMMLIQKVPRMMHLRLAMSILQNAVAISISLDYLKVFKV